MTQTSDRRDFIKLGGLGGLAVAAAGGATVLGAQQAAIPRHHADALGMGEGGVVGPDVSRGSVQEAADRPADVALELGLG